MTLQEQLESVQKAIAAAEQAQSYSFVNRSVQRASLDVLYRREAQLKAAISRQETGIIPLYPGY